MTALAALVLLAAASCTDAPKTSARNVLLITIDTLRADHLGAYGYARPTSPAIDELAGRSIVFDNAQVQSAWTLPSLASLMTSLHSSTHACWRFDSRLDESFTTLAELLRARGYATGGVASHVFLDERYGLQQGFEDFDVELVTDFVASHEAITSERVTEIGLRWLDGRASDPRPWLLWVHYFDPHAPYREHRGLSKHFGTHDEQSLYDGEIAYTDRAIGELLSGLESRGLSENTIVVLTADHGEEFGEHGGTGHGRTLHGEVLHVPMLWRVPELGPRRVDTPVQSVDVLPTLLDLLGLEPGHAFAGRSLVPAMRGEALAERAIFAELALNPNNPVDSLSEGGWKLLRQRASGHLLLFDTVSDPMELEDVAGEHGDVVERLLARLDASVQRAHERSEAFTAAPPLDLSAEELERLRALGYVEASH